MLGLLVKIVLLLLLSEEDVEREEGCVSMQYRLPEVWEASSRRSLIVWRLSEAYCCWNGTERGEEADGDFVIGIADVFSTISTYLML